MMMITIHKCIPNGSNRNISPFDTFGDTRTMCMAASWKKETRKQIWCVRDSDPKWRPIFSERYHTRLRGLAITNGKAWCWQVGKYGSGMSILVKLWWHNNDFARRPHSMWGFPAPETPHPSIVCINHFLASVSLKKIVLSISLCK